MPRDVNGNYTLVAGNPVLAGTLIESAWANSTLGDIADGITNSLSRNGNGGMLAPLRGTDGTVALPSYSFTNEPNSGIYREGLNDLRLSINSVAIQRWTPTQVYFYQPVSFLGAAPTLFDEITVNQVNLPNDDVVGFIEFGGNGFISSESHQYYTSDVNNTGDFDHIFQTDGTSGTELARITSEQQLSVGGYDPVNGEADGAIILTQPVGGSGNSLFVMRQEDVTGLDPVDAKILLKINGGSSGPLFRSRGAVGSQQGMSLIPRVDTAATAIYSDGVAPLRLAPEKDQAVFADGEVLTKLINFTTTVGAVTGNGDHFMAGRMLTGGMTDILPLPPGSLGVLVDTSTFGTAALLAGSTVTQPFTSLQAPNVFGQIGTRSTSGGGLLIRGYSGAAGTLPGIEFAGYANNPSSSLGTEGAFEFSGYKSDGGTGVVALDDSEIFMSFRNNLDNFMNILAEGTIKLDGQIITGDADIPTYGGYTQGSVVLPNTGQVIWWDDASSSAGVDTELHAIINFNTSAGLLLTGIGTAGNLRGANLTGIVDTLTTSTTDINAPLKLTGSFFNGASNVGVGAGNVAMGFYSGSDTLGKWLGDGNLHITGDVTANGVLLTGGGVGSFNSWTPEVADAASGGTLATVTITAFYQVIGSLCWVYVSFNVTNENGATGTNLVHVRNLPFTPAHDAIGAAHRVLTAVGTEAVVARLNSVNESITFTLQDASSLSVGVTWDDVGATNQFEFSMLYPI